jgi:hypothetical protein
MPKEDTQFKKGEIHNPNGRPVGSKSYETKRREAIIELAKRNKTTPEEIELMIHLKGIGEALKGSFQFYKDDMDRVYGQATQKHDITTKGESINPEALKKADQAIKTFLENDKSNNTGNNAGGS